MSAEELCGSTSTTRARPLASAVTAASARASVVLPTPPFWLGTATIHGLAILASASVLSRCLPWRFERPSDCPSWLRGRPETCTANREETDAGRDDRRDDLRGS